MRKIIPYIILLLSLTSHAQEHKAVSDFSRYRPLNDFRLWTVIVKDTVVGKLTSKVIGTDEIDGEDAYVLEETLNLNYKRPENPLTMVLNSRYFCGIDGYFLGIDMSLEINQNQGGIKLYRNGDYLEGVSIRGDDETDEELKYQPNRFAIENDFYDQFELFWAMRDFKVGDVIEDSIFVPRTMNYTKLRAQVSEFAYKNLYNTLYDSVFVISYSHPLEQIHFFSRDNRLLKVINPSLGLKAYLDIVRIDQTTERVETPTFLSRLRNSSLLGIGLTLSVYLLFGLISIIFFIGQGYRWKISYFSLFSGVVIFGLIPYTQIPLVEYLFTDIFLPNVTEGGSPYVWGLLPAVITGLMQIIMIALVIWVVSKYSNLKKYKYSVIGSLAGMGFGIAEAFYLTMSSGIIDIFSITILERGFTILYHVTAGALIGYALSKKPGYLIKIIILTVILNCLFRYLPIFVQAKAASAELLTILLAFISTMFLLGVIILFKKRLE